MLIMTSMVTDRHGRGPVWCHWHPTPGGEACAGEMIRSHAPLMAGVLCGMVEHNAPCSATSRYQQQL